MADRSRCKPCSVVLVLKQQNEKRNKLRTIKLEQGCIDCGYNDHPDALDFDHLGDKSFNISRAVLSRNWSIIEAEIKKCVVRCANCHRIKTAARRLR